MNDPGRVLPGTPNGSGDGGGGGLPRALHLPEHSHAAHFYDSREEQLGVVAAFFRTSLEERCRCVYVHNQRDDAAALQELVRAGLDASTAVETADLQLAGRGAMPSAPGELHVDGLMAFLGERVREAAAAGYHQVRGVGDMVWTIPADPLHTWLPQYETQVTGALHDLPVAAICQYDRARFGDGSLFDVLFTHPWLVVAGIICRNPYYVPQASFGERQRGSMDLDEALGNVLARERQERWLAVAEGDLELHGGDSRAVDVGRLAAIYEHMRDYKLALRERVRWRAERQPGAPARQELAALDGEIEWLERRASLWRRRELQSSGLFFDPASGTLAYRGRAVGLSRLEVALMRVLLEQAGRPIQASQLIRSAWERNVRTEAQLRNYIVRLRAKLETLGVPASIVTLRGRGYRLAPQTEPAGHS